MNGGVGKFGQTYTVMLGDTPVNITLLGAEYTIAPFNLAEGRVNYVDADHKFLVIHYMLKNPNKSDMYVSSQGFFQAVDSENNTIDDGGDCHEVVEKKTLDVTMKPGQGSKEIVSYIVVPAKGVIPKLIFKDPMAGTSKQIIRFNLEDPANAVKPIPAPYADTSDKAGATALPTISASTGTSYTFGYVNMSVDSLSLAPGPFGDLQAGDGKQFLVANVTVSNPTWAHRYFTPDMMKSTLKTEDDKIEDADYLKAKHDEKFTDNTFDPDDTMSYRMLIRVPKDGGLKTLNIYMDMGNDGKSRVFVYDVSGVK
jgi:hypothetical protein